MVQKSYCDYQNNQHENFHPSQQVWGNQPSEYNTINYSNYEHKGNTPIDVILSPAPDRKFFYPAQNEQPAESEKQKQAQQQKEQQEQKQQKEQPKYKEQQSLKEHQQQKYDFKKEQPAAFQPNQQHYENNDEQSYKEFQEFQKQFRQYQQEEYQKRQKFKYQQQQQPEELKRGYQQFLEQQPPNPESYQSFLYQPYQGYHQNYYPSLHQSYQQQPYHSPPHFPPSTNNNKQFNQKPTNTLYIVYVEKAKPAPVHEFTDHIHPEPPARFRLPKVNSNISPKYPTSSGENKDMLHKDSENIYHLPTHPKLIPPEQLKIVVENAHNYVLSNRIRSLSEHHSHPQPASPVSSQIFTKHYPVWPNYRPYNHREGCKHW